MVFAQGNENPLRMITNARGQELFNYVQKIGFKVFGARGENGLKNLLSDNPSIEELNEETLDPWKFFLLNLKSWIEIEKIDSTQKAKFMGSIDNLLQISDKDLIGVYSEIINKKPFKKSLFNDLVGHSLKEISQIFLNYYNQLLLLVKKYPHKSAQDALKDYISNSKNKAFNLNEFFKDYINVFKSNTDTSKERNSVIALTLSGILDGDETYEQQQLKVTLLINLLEELIFQSKTFYLRKPLSKEQITVAQLIVNDLYSLYPASNTYTVANIVKLATTKEIKPYFLIWSAARVMMITLRAYLRKAAKI